MPATATARRLLAQEARALLMRLARLRPFVLNMPMVPAAAISPAAMAVIESHMRQARQRLRGYVRAYLRWLRGPDGAGAGAARMQRGFTLLKLRFNAVI